MPDPDPELLLSPALIALSLLQLAFFFAGLALLWRRRHRWRERLTGEFPARLASSSRSAGGMLIACLIVVAGGLAGQIIASHFGRTAFPPAADGTMGLFHVIAGAGFQLGLLAGLLAAWLRLQLDVPVDWHYAPKDEWPHGIQRVRLTRASGDILLERSNAVDATLTQPGQPSHDIVLPRRTLRECLAEELRRLDPDLLYGRVITTGWELLGPPRSTV